MAVTISNQIENHRGIYWEVTGDGATASFTVTHNRYRRPNHSVQVFGVLVGTFRDRRSDRGGLETEVGGTVIALNSASVAPTTGIVSVTTTAAIGNGVKGYFVAVFDQTAD
jgi:hypothetical protein